MLTDAEIREAVQRLNRVYGRGELRGHSCIQKAENGHIVAIADCQYGYSTFGVKVINRTVYTRGHQLTVKKVKASTIDSRTNKAIAHL
jgi:hypothetical protein